MMSRPRSQGSTCVDEGGGRAAGHIHMHVTAYMRYQHRVRAHCLAAFGCLSPIPGMEQLLLFDIRIMPSLRATAAHSTPAVRPMSMCRQQLHVCKCACCRRVVQQLQPSTSAFGELKASSRPAQGLLTGSAKRAQGQLKASSKRAQSELKCRSRQSQGQLKQSQEISLGACGAISRRLQGEPEQQVLPCSRRPAACIQPCALPPC